MLLSNFNEKLNFYIKSVKFKALWTKLCELKDYDQILISWTK